MYILYMFNLRPSSNRFSFGFLMSLITLYKKLSFLVFSTPKTLQGPCFSDCIMLVHTTIRIFIDSIEKAHLENSNLFLKIHMVKWAKIGLRPPPLPYK